MSEVVQTKPPAHWAEAALAEVAAINPPLDRCIVSDDVLVDFVPMRAVEAEGGGLLRPETAIFGEVKKGYTSFIPGDVIMAKITPCMENGKTCVVPDLPGAACFGSTEFHVIRAERGIQSRWIAHFLLQHSTRYAAQRQMAGGVGQMRVPAAFLDALPLPVPPEREQARILDSLDELLSDLDAGVAALERVRAKLKHYRAAVLKAAVEGALTAEWRREHPATETADALLTRILAERRRRWEEAQLAKFAAAEKTPPKDWKTRYSVAREPDSDGHDALPDGWCFTSVGQLAEVGTGATPDRGRKERYYTDGKIAWVTSGCVNSARVLEPTEYVTPLALEECNLTMYPVGTLLLAMYGEGKTRGMCTELGIASTTNQALAAIQAPASVLKYLKIFLLKNYEETRRAATGGVQPNLNLGMVRRIRIPLPPLSEQGAIVEAVEEHLSLIDHLESDLEARLTSAVALRQGILRQAFTGQLVQQDPNDEPASELLKRIAVEREERARSLRAAKQAKPRLKSPRRRTVPQEQH